jgi:3'-5' exoribonuclease
VTAIKRRYIDGLGDGEGIEEIYLVGEKLLRANRNGNPYLQVELRDRTGSLTGRLWNAGEPVFRSFEEGEFVLVRGKVQLFQGALQIILNSIERVPPERVDLGEFLPHTEKDVAKLQQTLRTILMKVGNPHLRGLAECFLMDHVFLRDFSHAPAGVRNHHAYIGGLLEHVVNLLEVAERILPLYPRLNADLVLLGIFLHDIGKVRELSYARVFGYTDEGQLIGHLVIGVEMLAEKAKLVADLTGEPFPNELLLQLQHMIVSHHGTLEFGSPKVPMTPEAIFLNCLDNLDAKVHTFVRDIEEDRKSASSWTPFSQSLQRRLFKGARNSENGAVAGSCEAGD